MTDRELRLKVIDLMYEDSSDAIVKFIIADRRMIVEPLVKFNSNMLLGVRSERFEQDVVIAMNAIKETLKLAGVTDA